MNGARKKPLWPWIVALLIGLPMLYVVSIAPACWWFSKPTRDRDVRTVPGIYAPAWQLVRRLPFPLSRMAYRYIGLGVPEGVNIVFGKYE